MADQVDKTERRRIVGVLHDQLMVYKIAQSLVANATVGYEDCAILVETRSGARYRVTVEKEA